MRLALVSFGSPFDTSSWSGTPYHVLAELKRRFGDVHVIDTPRLDDLLVRGSALAPLGLLPAREPLVGAWFARRLSARLETIRPDAVVALAAEAKVAGLPARWPLLVISDSFFGNMVNYYEKYARLSRRTLDNGEAQQRAILDRGAGVLLSSEWAAATAAAHYGLPRSRFRVAPFGANFEHDPPPPPPRPNTGPLKLLFVGVDWLRKGGEVILPIFQSLRARLGDVELHIAGCHPQQTAGLAGVIHHGVLRKENPREAERLASLYREASFLLIPSRQEAFGLVVAEACAFGLPPVAADTGGVGTIIRNGVNGLLLPLTATAEDFAAAILSLWSDADAYRAMQAAARAAFETRLNWRAWGDEAECALAEVTAPASKPLALTSAGRR
jgi:glycosyltransferase involved in cell wall biosynthesis